MKAKELAALTVAELKKVCAQQGLSPIGRKADLVKRLASEDEATSSQQSGDQPGGGEISQGDPDNQPGGGETSQGDPDNGEGDQLQENDGSEHVETDLLSPSQESNEQDLSAQNDSIAETSENAQTGNEQEYFNDDNDETSADVEHSNEFPTQDDDDTIPDGQFEAAEMAEDQSFELPEEKEQYDVQQELENVGDSDAGGIDEQMDTSEVANNEQLAEQSEELLEDSMVVELDAHEMEGGGNESLEGFVDDSQGTDWNDLFGDDAELVLVDEEGDVSGEDDDKGKRKDDKDSKQGSSSTKHSSTSAKSSTRTSASRSRRRSTSRSGDRKSSSHHHSSGSNRTRSSTSTRGSNDKKDGDSSKKAHESSHKGSSSASRKTSSPSRNKSESSTAEKSTTKSTDNATSKSSSSSTKAASKSSSTSAKTKSSVTESKAGTQKKVTTQPKTKGTTPKKDGISKSSDENQTAEDVSSNAVTTSIFIDLTNESAVSSTSKMNEGSDAVKDTAEAQDKMDEKTNSKPTADTSEGDASKTSTKPADKAKSKSTKKAGTASTKVERKSAIAPRRDFARAYCLYNLESRLLIGPLKSEAVTPDSFKEWFNDCIKVSSCMYAAGEGMLVGWIDMILKSAGKVEEIQTAIKTKFPDLKVLSHTDQLQPQLNASYFDIDVSKLEFPQNASIAVLEDLPESLRTEEALSNLFPTGVRQYLIRRTRKGEPTGAAYLVFYSDDDLDKCLDACKESPVTFEEHTLTPKKVPAESPPVEGEQKGTQSEELTWLYSLFKHQGQSMPLFLRDYYMERLRRKEIEDNVPRKKLRDIEEVHPKKPAARTTSQLTRRSNKRRSGSRSPVRRVTPRASALSKSRSPLASGRASSSTSRVSGSRRPLSNRVIPARRISPAARRPASITSRRDSSPRRVPDRRGISSPSRSGRVLSPARRRSSDRTLLSSSRVLPSRSSPLGRRTSPNRRSLSPVRRLSRPRSTGVSRSPLRQDNRGAAPSAALLQRQQANEFNRWTEPARHSTTAEIHYAGLPRKPRGQAAQASAQPRFGEIDRENQQATSQNSQGALNILLGLTKVLDQIAQSKDGGKGNDVRGLPVPGAQGRSDASAIPAKRPLAGSFGPQSAGRGHAPQHGGPYGAPAGGYEPQAKRRMTDLQGQGARNFPPPQTYRLPGGRYN